MMPIPFTQYLLPNGRKESRTIERPGDIEGIANRFIASGGRYECEVLTTGEVSLTAVKKVGGEEGDVAIVLCRNEPDTIDPAVDDLVRQSEAFIGARPMECWTNIPQKYKRAALKAVAMTGAAVEYRDEPGLPTRKDDPPMGALWTALPVLERSAFWSAFNCFRREIDEGEG